MSRPPQPDSAPRLHTDRQNVAQSKRILIVDDSDSLRGTVRASLESHGFVCHEAPNGVDAIAKARQLQPDLIVLDLAMPMLNGYDTAVVLQRELPNVPVLLFTSYAEHIGSALAKSVGVKAIVAKSDGMTALLKGVQSLLGS